MKILRIRRGFTTNSSSAAEYVTATPEANNNQAKTPAPASSGGAQNPGNSMPIGASIVILPSGASPNSGNNVVRNNDTSAQNSPISGENFWHSWSNGVLVVGVAALVGVVVGIERIIGYCKNKKS